MVFPQAECFYAVSVCFQISLCPPRASKVAGLRAASVKSLSLLELTLRDYGWCAEFEDLKLESRYALLKDDVSDEEVGTHNNNFLTDAQIARLQTSMVAKLKASYINISFREDHFCQAVVISEVH